MEFEDFFASIASSDLKAVARHWQEARAGRTMPGWRDIQPKRIGAQLAMVWSYTYDAGSDSFTGRLAGERISTVFGKNFRGLPMKDAYPAHDYPRLFARAKRVITEPALYNGYGMVFRFLDRSGQGERIMMPLAADGVHGDGIFAATDYPMHFAEVQAHIDFGSETDSWFGLTRV